jgi:hypothetical protein
MHTAWASVFEFARASARSPKNEAHYPPKVAVSKLVSSLKGVFARRTR